MDDIVAFIARRDGELVYPGESFVIAGRHCTCPCESTMSGHRHHQSSKGKKSTA